MPLSPTESRLAHLVILVGAISTIGIPLASTLRTVGLSITPSELIALLKAAATSSTIATPIALLVAILAVPVAIAVPGPWLVAAFLLGSGLRAYGTLALGFSPGRLAIGVTWVSAMLPLAAALVQLRWMTLPIAHLESAADLGARPRQRFRWIVWPYLRPSLVLAVAWVMLQILGDTLVADIAGGGKIYGLGVAIRDAALRDGRPARASTGLLGLLLPSFGVTWVASSEIMRMTTSTSRRPPLRNLSLRWLGRIIFILSLLPAAGLARWAFQPGPWQPATIVTSLGPTVIVGAAGALAGTVVGGSLAYLQRLQPKRWLIAWLGLPLVLPPGVFGALTLQGWGSWIGPGYPLSILAIIPTCSAIGFLITWLAVASVPRALEDAMADLGARLGTRLRQLWLPFSTAALGSAALVCFGWVASESESAAFCAGPGQTRIATAFVIQARTGETRPVGGFGVSFLGISFLAASLWRRPPWH